MLRLHKYGKDANSPWPYSVVTNHIDEEWIPSTQQPKTDILVSFYPEHLHCSFTINLIMVTYY